MDALFATKTILAPALIGAASWLTRWYGPAAGGWFAALPLTSGPVVLVLEIQHGPVFAAEACVGILLALISLCAFVLVYSWSAATLNWAGSSALGCAAYLCSTCLLRYLPVRLAVAFLLACVVLAATFRCMPTGLTTNLPTESKAWEVPVRMMLAAVLVWLLTSAAGFFGPRMSGLLTPFPVAASILAAATHRCNGVETVRHLLRSLLAGLFSFAVFFLIVGEMIRATNASSAFVDAALSACAVHFVIWRWIRHE